MRRSPTLVAFDAAGHLDASGAFWHVPTELWAYRQQDSSVRKGLIAGLLRTAYGLETNPSNQALFDRRVNLLLADNASRIRPTGRIASENLIYPPTRGNGHTRFAARLSAVSAGATAGARLPITPVGGAQGSVHLISPEGISVISDIDDTVKDTGVLDKRRLWDSTFFQPFKVVAGMPELVRALCGADGVAHYVSSTPWHLYAPLREWLEAETFPISSLHLKQIRLKDSSILDIFKSPQALKAPVIADLLRRWPKRQFVLVGDSGEKDPEIYGALASRHPTQIARIIIRRAPGDTSQSSRFKQAFTGFDPGKWQVFEAPGEITWRP